MQFGEAVTGREGGTGGREGYKYPSECKPIFMHTPPTHSTNPFAAVLTVWL